MKAYIIRTNRKIDPFQDHPRDCLIANKPLSQLQDDALQQLGLEPIMIDSESAIRDSDEYISLIDTLYFTPELLVEFIARSRIQHLPSVCALKNGISTLRTAVSLQDVLLHESHVEYNLRYFPKNSGMHTGDFSPVVIDPDQFTASIKMPYHMCDAENYCIPMTEKLIVQIDHWVNLWVANILAVLSDGARLQRSPKIKLVFMALKSLSFNQWKILRQLNKFGKSCDIHPTAYIEGSLLGANVSVGAGSIVRESFIGDGVYIGNGVVIEESVIGDGCTILNGHFLYSVLYPNSFSVAEMVSASLVGRDSFMGLNTTLTDFRLDRSNGIVIKDGVRVDTGNRFLGGCLGHGVHLGSGSIVSPSRSISNTTRLATRRNVVRSFRDGAEMPDFRLIDI